MEHNEDPKFKVMDNQEENKRISVLGCGWYGLELAKKLIEKDYTVSGSSTSTDKLTLLKQFNINPFLVNFEKELETYDPDFFSCDVLLICIPPKRSTGEQDSFSGKIKRIAATADQYGVQQVIFISSTSVYGDHNGEVTEETATSPDTESGKAIANAESLLTNYKGFTTTVIRFGGLIGPGRDPGRFFAGKTEIPNGQAPVNLIHLTDCIGITLSILENKAFGYIYNACAPSHPSRQDFYTRASIASGLAKPDFVDELLGWKRITSINTDRLLNYHFVHNFYSTE
ncbi:SDR family oxidoreductase [Pedobacter sp. MR2016-24]|uniref:SDR family oxidoreductase n=1 Tax=Pedobacter sp. MR2016-24 TaxID=2994466 RepID=UPI002247FD6F|nr:SDR family oxidoreductase [Pedobacter sp. MR2016-24]MCX2486781.1 SDR family oxidoreductase [Pedobacter sp. MR2016-24]